MATFDATPNTIEIPLNKGYVTVVDWCDADLGEEKWHAQVLTPELVYAARFIKTTGQCQELRLHRVILARMLERELSSNEQVDHINCNGCDNRRSNLRLATHSQNQHNQRINRANTSGYKGVYWHKVARRWRAHIKVNGVRQTLGFFDTAQEAHDAYCEAATRLFGEFARFG